MIRFRGEPELRPHADGIHWSLVNDFEASDYKRGGVGWVRVKADFVTDLGSIPKVFQNIISPEGRPLRAYIVHDWLYAVQNVTRAQADSFLLRAMKAINVPWYERWTIYIAVRLGGWSAWRSDANKRRRS